MQCPTCGTEVVAEAVFCHKCGERLDAAAQQFPPRKMDEVHHSSQYLKTVDADPETEPAPAAADQLRKTAAARTQEPQEPEKQLWQGGSCAKAMAGTWAVCLLITAGLGALGIWLSGFEWASGKWLWIVLVVLIVGLWLYEVLLLAYRRASVRYLLTTQRFMHEKGILRRVTDRIEVIDMDDITFEQGVWERLVGVGTIKICSSDRTHPVLVMRGIEEVKKVSGIMDDVRRTERRRRGLHIEQI